MSNYLKNQGTWKLSQLKKLSFEEIKAEFDKLVQRIDTFVPMDFEATKPKLKRYGEELQTKTLTKQKIDDKDVPVIGEKVVEVKEEEPVKRIGKRKKQKARKGISVDKNAQGDSETDKEESVEAMNPTPLAIKSNIMASSIYMLVDRKYPLSKDACQVMLKMKLLDGTMDEVCYKLLKMIEKQAGIRKSNAPTNEYSSQAPVAQDGLGGYDWSNDFEVEPVNYALMAISSSSSSSSFDSEVQQCSKCLESFKCIQKNYDTEREKHNKANLEFRGYEITLESLESRIIGHEKNELAWEKVVKERDELKDKIAKWEESTKNLEEILKSQMSARDKTGLGYSTQLNELSSNHETNSENSLSIFDGRSSNDEHISEKVLLSGHVSSYKWGRAVEHGSYWN
ncbi:hypothetical protein Tco_0736518 [Tanacetum coccineum]